MVNANRPLCFCDSCRQEYFPSNSLSYRRVFYPYSMKREPRVSQRLITGRTALLRDRLPRRIADAMDRLPIPRFPIPVLNVSPYPDTSPESNPRRAASRLLELTNSYRRKYGLNSIRLSGVLCEVARRHSADQAERRDMTHTGAHGSSLRDRLVRGGYRFRSACENVAFGYMSEDHVFNGWRTSSGHRANLLKAGVEDMGAWVVEGRNGLYWTQVLARRS